MSEILIMEDDADQALLLRDALVNAGHSVTVTYDGAEAWLLLQSKRFDVLLTDLYIAPARKISSGLGGFSLIGRIRQTSNDEERSDGLSEMKIIAITGGANFLSGQNPLQMASSFGADMCFQKPVDFSALIASINDLT